MKAAEQWARTILDQWCYDALPEKQTLERITALVRRIQQEAADQAVTQLPPLTHLRCDEERLRAIRERHEASTSGVWKLVTEDQPSGTLYNPIPGPSYDIVLEDDPLETIIEWIGAHRCEDLDFAAHAHQDIPDLLEDHRLLRRQLEDCMQENATQIWRSGHDAGYEAGLMAGRRQGIDAGLATARELQEARERELRGG